MSCDKNLFYNRHLRPADIKAILIRKFHRVHDVKLVPVNNSLHLKVSYQKPMNPQEYEMEIVKITSKINQLQSSEFFITTVLNNKEYPDFIINDGEVIDIPILIDLHANVETL